MGSRKPLSVRVPQVLLDALDQAAEKAGQTRTEFVEQRLGSEVGVEPAKPRLPSEGEPDEDPEVERIAAEIVEQGDATGAKHGLPVARQIARQRLGIVNPNREAVAERADELQADDHDLSRRAAERLAARELFPLASLEVGNIPEELRSPAEKERVLGKVRLKGDPEPPKAA